MNRRKLLLLTVLFIGLGFFLMMGGLLYDIAFAGIPYQDPPPELAAEYNAASRLATNLFLVGGTLASVGALGAVVLSLLTVKTLLGRSGQGGDAAGDGDRGD